MRQYRKRYNIGDITSDGFEVIDVNYVPEYTLRKRVVLLEDIDIKNMEKTYTINRGEKGVLYVFPNERESINFKSDEYNISIDPESVLWEEY